MLPLDHAYQRICVICEFWTEILPEWEYQNARIALWTILLHQRLSLVFVDHLDAIE